MEEEAERGFPLSSEQHILLKTQIIAAFDVSFLPLKTLFNTHTQPRFDPHHQLKTLKPQPQFCLRNPNSNSNYLFIYFHKTQVGFCLWGSLIFFFFFLIKLYVGRKRGCPSPYVVKLFWICQCLRLRLTTTSTVPRYLHFRFFILPKIPLPSRKYYNDCHYGLHLFFNSKYLLPVTLIMVCLC